jgi:3-phenylpropionate/cinnamic acid dioxygenase small subunit
MIADFTTIASDLLYREALYLDEKRWDEWLGLFTDPVEFWVPAWKSEGEPTSDPSTEVSLLYMSTHLELAERVARVRSGKSNASTPLPRTAHAVTNILAEPDANGEALTARCVTTTHIYNVKRREAQLVFARGLYGLVRRDGEWRIRRKKLLLLNDYIPTMLDFYTI